jgi:hypothetical protein
MAAEHSDQEPAVSAAVEISDGGEGNLRLGKKYRRS